jgi:hypothetical protein
VPSERLGWHLARGRQDRERNREVEPGALLTQLGRGEIDGDPPRRPLELSRGYTAADPLLRLLACAICEPDDREGRDPELQVSLDLDAAGLEADKGVRDGACEHVVTLDSKGSRVCDRPVTKVGLVR